MKLYEKVQLIRAKKPKNSLLNWSLSVYHIATVKRKMQTNCKKKFVSYSVNITRNPITCTDPQLS